MIDAKQTLIDYKGVFLNQGCLFVSTTGKLLSGYVNCEVLYPYDEPIRHLVTQLIAPFLNEVEGFVCPATGDIVLLREAIRQANDLGLDTTAVWADKHDDNTYWVERNGFVPAIQGKRVVVLNDRISQGGTTVKVIAEARRHGCEVLGVATLAGVSAATPEFLDVPVVNALCTIDVQAFPVDQIPEEFQGLPIAADEPLGHGSDWEAHPDKHPWEHGFVHLLTA